jgi:uroporphyrinogen decarboxylase
MQSSKELMERVLRCEKGDRIPYCPAIYEHMGFLIGKTPSQIGRDADLLVQGLLAEYETYHPDFLSVGIDVYNVEAEALGCEVLYFDDGPDVPGISDFPVKKPEDLDKLGIPDPTSDGRMPLFLKAAEEAQRLLGDKVIIRGAVTGPFSMASELVGAENLIVMSLLDPSFIRRLLKFTATVAAEFGKAFIERGIDPVIFDSRAMPPLCSPDVFKDMVAPAYAQHLTPVLKEAGAKYLPLIIGGNTTPILEALIATGATQLLCDFEGDREAFMKRCLEEKLPMRVNVDPRLLHTGPIDRIQDFALTILKTCWDHPGFILGTGVAAYDCPKEHILAVGECLDMDYKNYVPRDARAGATISQVQTITAEVRPAYADDIDPVLREMAVAIEDGEEDDVPELVTEALGNGVAPGDIVNKAMIPAMEIVGDRFSHAEIYVPEMLISARAMKAGMEVLRPALIDAGAKPVGTVMLGTVQGDIHDIGKNLVGMMLEGAGFEIVDLGVNVPVARFIEELQRTGIRILGLSALLTTTMRNMKAVLGALEDAGLRDEVIVLLGGAPITPAFCDEVGADLIAESAADAVVKAKEALRLLAAK